MPRSNLRGIPVLLALTVALVGQPLLSATPASAAPPASTAAVTSSTKGPVGWDTYRQLDRLPELTTGVQTKQFSSFDRGGANGDFRNSLTHAADGYLLAEHQGPGEITSIWSTRNEGDVRETGNIRVTLDGKKVLDAPLQDVVDGKLGAPFVFPLVANATQSSGGVNISVPMPYQRSMRITTDIDPEYYNVITRTFADAVGVTTFDLTDRAPDVIAQLAAAGTRDPKPAQPNARTIAASAALAPGETAALGALTGPGAVSAVQLRIPQLTGTPKRTYLDDDGRAFGADGAADGGADGAGDGGAGGAGDGGAGGDAYSQFTVALDPKNTGVRLTRRLNPDIAEQQADIYVDGVKAAAWAPLPAPREHLWQDQSVELPASATTGKSQITVRNVFVSSSKDFNEYTYWVDSMVDGKPVRTDTVDVGPQHLEQEQAHQYTIAGQTDEGHRVSYYPPSAAEQRALAATREVLQSARLRVTVDGQRTVDAPLGEYFGSANQLSPVRSLMYGMDPDTQTLSAWWSMPYAQNAVVELYNGSQRLISTVDTVLTAAADPQVAEQLGPAGNLSYFRATSNRAETTPGQDYVFLQASGWGKFVGVTHTMNGPASRQYLEGDERVYVDGARTPQIHGTGTEDFYRGGWYFNRGTFTNPLFGNPSHETGTAACRSDCTGAYRQLLADAVPFHSALTFGIEHGPVNNEQATYSSTAYSYSRPTAVQRSTDTLDVGDPASEQAHQYSSTDPGPVIALTATYEGNDAVPTPVTDTVRATASPVSFTLDVDPANTGVTLRRMSDQRQRGQSARIMVDGQEAGLWQQPLSNPFHRWLDDSFELPRALTQGKTQVTVRLEPTAGQPAFSAARYQALSTVAPFLDEQAPTQVSGVRAQRTDFNNTITLSWAPASDDVGVDHYAVYGSTDPAFVPAPDTLIGTTKVESFSHGGLGLLQGWRYRVVAVDAAENGGSPSKQAFARSGIIPTIPTTTTLVFNPAPAPGAATILFALVAPDLVLGTMDFRDGDRPIAGCTARPVIVGYAFCVTTFTPAAQHPITAVYSGDGLHTTSTGFHALNVSAEWNPVQFALGVFLQLLRNLHLFGL